MQADGKLLIFDYRKKNCAVQSIKKIPTSVVEPAVGAASTARCSAWTGGATKVQEGGKRKSAPAKRSCKNGQVWPQHKRDQLAY